jgi:hypothetical protein
MWTCEHPRANKDNVYVSCAQTDVDDEHERSANSTHTHTHARHNGHTHTYETLTSDFTARTPRIPGHTVHVHSN